MRRALRIFKWGVFAITAILIAALGIVLFVLFFPKQAWILASPYILPKDVSITAQNIEWRIDRLHLDEVRWHLALDGLVIDRKTPRWHVPVQRLVLDTDIRFFQFSPFRFHPDIHIENLEIDAAKSARIHLPSSRASKNRGSPLEQISRAFALSRKAGAFVSVDRLIIQFARIDIQPDTGLAYRLRGRIQKLKTEDRVLTKVHVENALDPAMHLDLSGVWRQPVKANNYLFLNAQVGFAGHGLQTDRAELTGRWQPKVLSIHIDARKTDLPTHLRLQNFTAQLSVQNSHLDVEASGRLAGLPKPLDQPTEFHLQAQVPLSRQGGLADGVSHIHVATSLPAFFIRSRFKSAIERQCRCRIPKALDATAEARVQLKTLLDGTDAPALARVQIRLQPIHNSIFNLDMGADLDVGRQNSRWTFRPFVDTSLTIARFQQMKNLLHTEGVFIPAPFDVLDGRIHLQAHGDLRRTTKTGRTVYIFPVEGDVQLASKTQKVRLSAQTDIQFDPRSSEVNMRVHVDIHDLDLNLPPLRPFGGFVPLIPDRRFIQNPPSGSPRGRTKKFKLALSLDVTSDRPDSIRLSSEYAKPYIPLSLRIDDTPAHSLSGLLTVSPFELHFFRRVTYVESFLLHLGAVDGGAYPIQGRLRFDRDPYQIHMIISGTTAAPQVRFESHPYLDKNDIISMLIYGRLSEELVTADAETVGGVQAAIADRAIGLIGLWAFATTPIQNFSYNPVTKIYTATLSLGKGLTATIGTNWEQTTQLEVRKRLSRRWVLTASWQPSTDETSSGGKVILEWERRF